jgi:hypothetical protein
MPVLRREAVSFVPLPSVVSSLSCLGGPFDISIWDGEGDMAGRIIFRRGKQGNFNEYYVNPGHYVPRNIPAKWA